MRVAPPTDVRLDAFGTHPDQEPGQRAVVLSNYTRDPVREHARLAGADAVFDKSFELEALVAYCEQLAEPALR